MLNCFANILNYIPKLEKHYRLYAKYLLQKTSIFVGLCYFLSNYKAICVIVAEHLRHSLEVKHFFNSVLQLIYLFNIIIILNYCNLLHPFFLY